MNPTRCLLAALGTVVLTTSLIAQPPGYRPPNSSPAYGWLGRGTPTQRYLNDVLPQTYNQAAFQNIQQQFDAFGRAATTPNENDLTAEGIRPTGRGATFMNFGHYYPRMGGAAGGARAASAGAAPGRR